MNEAHAAAVREIGDIVGDYMQVREPPALPKSPDALTAELACRDASCAEAAINNFRRLVDLSGPTIPHGTYSLLVPWSKRAMDQKVAFVLNHFGLK